MNQPKPDQALFEALARLRNFPDFQRLVKYQREMHEYHKHLLVTAAPTDIPALQGKAQEQLAFFNLLEKAPK